MGLAPAVGTGSCGRRSGVGLCRAAGACGLDACVAWACRLGLVTRLTTVVGGAPPRGRCPAWVCLWLASVVGVRSLRRGLAVRGGPGWLVPAGGASPCGCCPWLGVPVVGVPCGRPVTSAGARCSGWARVVGACRWGQSVWLLSVAGCACGWRPLWASGHFGGGSLFGVGPGGWCLPVGPVRVAVVRGWVCLWLASVVGGAVRRALAVRGWPGGWRLRLGSGGRCPSLRTRLWLAPVAWAGRGCWCPRLGSGRGAGAPPGPWLGPAPAVRYLPVVFAALAAAFISCLCARTFASDSGPVMSATERKDFGSP
ncbi:hypothetical protein SCNRRL3882_4192 [Streptomyces chartreusis NRRL 3882]|uniref:Uncharacterized protein n=1 Tax=Streptomyces chartreusis NRRL 3882 TaxID=1079985 RepID=A0A2N9BBK2_STRCX|nr:hypothetical protein SCNRRL3882_4192 [Streptomyces chartreusis NRRL 3882]